MAESRFDIHFKGQLVAGADPAAVKANLAKLFKIDEARAGAMLDGRTVVLKKDADQATAMKFRAAIKQAGAICELVALNQSEPEEITLTAAPPSAEPASRPAVQTVAPVSTPAPRPVAAAGQQPQVTSGKLETVGTIRTGGQGFVGSFEVAPVGTVMDQSTDTRPRVNPDISGLSMAAVGADLGQKPKAPAPPPPDISGLSLEPAKP